jgi:hypothetical protein
MAEDRLSRTGLIRADEPESFLETRRFGRAWSTVKT